MYNMDTEEGQMMSFLWDMLGEGEYSDAATLANQMLKDNPNNGEAVAVLAIVYEKMAEASHDGGDEESEKEFLEKALSQYLKLLAINPDSIADKIKANKIRRKLRGDVKAEFSGDYLKDKWLEIKEKLLQFYDDKLSLWIKTKQFKYFLIGFSLVIVGLIVWACVAGSLNEKVPEKVFDDEKSVASSGPAENTYTGPMDTIIIENDNAKAERAEKEIAENYEKQKRSLQTETQHQSQFMDQGYSAPKRSQRSDSYYRNSNVPKQGNFVKPFKVPFTDLELKSPEDSQVPSSDEKKEDTKEDTKEKVSENKEETPKDKPEQKPANPALKRADSLLNRAVKEYSAGNTLSAKQMANEAKQIYGQEMSKGNGSRRIRSNMETADTILGDNR